MWNMIRLLKGKIIKEKQGNQLDQDKFYSYVEKALST